MGMCLCECVSHEHGYPQRPEEGIGRPSAAVKAAQCECWELNSGPLVEWQVLLTTESFLQCLAFDLQECFLATVGQTGDNH